MGQGAHLLIAQSRLREGAGCSTTDVFPKYREGLPEGKSLKGKYDLHARLDRHASYQLQIASQERLLHHIRWRWYIVIAFLHYSKVPIY